jgi:hypothetical protein
MLWVSVATVCLVLAFVACWVVAAARKRLAVADRAAAQLVARRGEQERFLRPRTDIADTADVASAVVDLGTGITQASHQTIAAIPFEILEAIPATSEVAKIVREVHDQTAATVYRAVSAVTGEVAGVIGRRLRGDAPRARPAPRPRPRPAPPKVSPEDETD